MTGYRVKPTGVVSNFSQGGLLVYEENGHGLVVSLFDLPDSNWLDAKNACDELILNGYSDWRLPSIEELEIINKELYQFGLGNFKRQNEPTYWSIAEYSDGEYYAMGYLMSELKVRQLRVHQISKENEEIAVRAVRLF